MRLDTSVNPLFGKLLIANRGEIACRVIRTANRLGIATVAIYAEADADALHVRLADEAVFIGASKATESYLDIDKVISAAISTNCNAIHPGYGFLSENPEFVRQCESNKIILVGPSADSIEKMGIKDTAKTIARDCKIPVLSGYEGDNQAKEFLLQQAELIGFPVMIKAVAGGGGKGLKIAEDRDSFCLQLESARREAGASFGNEKMLLEKYLESPRHIEIQVFADRHGNVVSLFERDCSIQRRHQKILEEAPATNFSARLRAEMGAAACKLAETIAYEGAGTVEFLVDTQGQYFFLEMNTRLQVEHGITEAITGLDLVEWQLLVAAGAELPLKQEEIAMQGHAIEARLCAEDPAGDFLPSTGAIEYMKLPQAAFGMRFDMGYVLGDSVSSYYDSLLGKLIVWGPDRQAAVRRISEILGSTLVAGIDSNINYLQRLVSSAPYQQAEINTAFISNFVDDVRGSAVETMHWAVAAVSKAMREQGSGHRDGWRLNGANRIRIGLNNKGSSQQLYLTEAVKEVHGQSWNVRVGAETCLVEADEAKPDRFTVVDDDNKIRKIFVPGSHSEQTQEADDRIICFEGNKPFIFQSINRISDYATTLIGASASSDLAAPYSAPMNGTVAAILVAVNDEVDAGTILMVVEAMKMEFPIMSQHKGSVREFFFAEGDNVEQGNTLLDLEAT